MRRFFAIPAAVLTTLGAAHAHELPPAPEAVLQPDSTGQGFDYLWDGTADSTYFVMGSADLATWFYFNVMEQGDPDGHRFWLHSNSPHFFLKLRYTAEATYPWSDPDGDDLTNAFELEYDLPVHLLEGQSRTALDPFNDDSDGDHVRDGGEDPDEDGLSNCMEQNLGLNPLLEDSDQDGTLDGDEDPDNDELSNLIEQRLGLDPLSADSDGDGTLDKNEDTDQDGIDNRAEITAGLEPWNPDSDGDGIPDGEDPDPDNPELLVLAASQPRVLSPLE